MAWIDAPLVPIEVVNRDFETLDTTLYIAQLTPSVTAASGPVKISHNLFAWESSDASVSPYGEMQVSPGGFSLRFTPVVPIRIQSVEALTIHLAEGNWNQQSGNLLVDLSLWDVQAGAWAPIEVARWGEIKITDPARYVGPGGEVRMKLDSPTNDPVMVASATITLLVNP
jgi:hypothetical protein